ncbi:MAG: hypothetical protein RL161_246 [Bacteroidota bacterium]
MLRKICFILLVMVAGVFSVSIQAQSKLQVIGINRTGHRIEPEMKYEEGHSSDLSARYQLFVLNRGGAALPTGPKVHDEAKSMSIWLNGKTPAQWHSAEKISWYQFPEQDKNFPDQIPAGALMVWSFNGKNQDWQKNNSFSLTTANLDTTILDVVQNVWMESVVFTGKEESLHPNVATIHLFNESTIDYTIEELKFWQALSPASWQFLFPGKALQPTTSWPAGQQLQAGGKSILKITSDDFRLGPVAIQIRLRNTKGEVETLWSYVKIKKESFDISAGWANGAINGKPAFLHETFLKTMRALYINTAHYNGQEGFSDKASLFERFPIKYFGHLLPWQQFDQDSLLSRMHGIEILGEPQYGGGTPIDPQKVCTELLAFAPSRIPSTLTHSEERLWRFYAGLSDYPHYDAYRVTAPSADEWGLYDRWNGKRIEWGSPLETIGTMTRSLKWLNRPLPIAYWSQGPHEGWEVYGGRKRTSPTVSELRAQAYHALASGITSFYWFNLSYKSLVLYPELLEPMQRIGREMRLLENFYLHGAQWNYHRIGSPQRPLWDLSTFVSPEGVLLFALDLDYRADAKTRTFIFQSNQKAALDFLVPHWVTTGWKLLRVDATGLKSMEFVQTGNSIRLQDNISEVGLYVLLPDEAAVWQLQQRWDFLRKLESSWDFDPIKNQNDLRTLMSLGSVR